MSASRRIRSGCAAWLLSRLVAEGVFWAPGQNARRLLEDSCLAGR